MPYDTADVQLVDLDGDGQDERVAVERAARQISAWGWEGRYWARLFEIRSSAEHGAKQSLLAEDLDGDGVVDFAVAWGAREGDLTTGVQVAFGEPAPTLEPWTPIEDDLAVLLQRPYDGWLSEEPPIEGPAPALHSGDLDGDGRPELIFDGGAAGEVILLWNEGDRRFRAEVLDATSALIVGPGDLVLTDDDVLWRVPVYGRRLGARAKVAEVQGRLDEAADCTGDELPDLLLRYPSRVMVGVSGSFVPSGDGYGAWSCGDIDGDGLPDMVSSIGAELWLRLSDPPS